MARTPEEEERKALKRARKEQKRAEKVARRAAAEDNAGEAPEPAKEKSKRKRDGEAGKDKAKKQKTAPEGAVVDRDSYFAANSISVEGGDAEFQPVLKFSDLALPAALIEVLSAFTAPTPVQACTWPILLRGRDVIGIARTGSGKTLGFGIPLFNHIRGLKHLPKAPFFPGLVLAPTRELAMQIQETFAKHEATSGVTSVCIYGGVSKGEQKQALSRGVHVAVATPGRLLDLMEEGACRLDSVSFLVLDEADRMLDMGFEKDVRTIISKIKNPHQTAMFSATWPPAIRKLASEFLKEPIRVTIGAAELQANEKITQHVEVMEQHDKDKRLFEVLAKVHGKAGKSKVLVFALYKKEAARLEETIRRRGYAVTGIHGDLSQNQRTKALADFKSGSSPICVATDVAARGLDIPAVEAVINVTFPLTIEDYVHRIGRTARGGATGTSYTFFTSAEKHLAAALANVLRDAGQAVPDSLRAFGGTVKKKLDPNYGAFAKDVDMSVKATKVTFDSDEE
ncbi:P-loop containing nucleoside triphosphate hydrolase protein [Hyaloraphidium curvatum]|nr:P-loop containing nucleoside triphosphate hydrolase protein [Hyaloraphidium curvatum]